MERHFKLKEIAEMWAISPERVRLLFMREPGVIRMRSTHAGKRKYTLYRIPESVLHRVRARMTNP